MTHLKIFIVIQDRPDRALANKSGLSKIYDFFIMSLAYLNNFLQILKVSRIFFCSHLIPWLLLSLLAPTETLFDE